MFYLHQRKAQRKWKYASTYRFTSRFMNINFIRIWICLKAIYCIILLALVKMTTAEEFVIVKQYLAKQTRREILWHFDQHKRDNQKENNALFEICVLVEFQSESVVVFWFVAVLVYLWCYEWWLSTSPFRYDFLSLYFWDE